ncbi:MAG: copper-binding protein [Pseudomonadota bacterium]
MLAHEAVKTLNWPAMTMKFGVKTSRCTTSLRLAKRCMLSS